MNLVGEMFYSDFFDDLQKLVNVLPPGITKELKKRDLTELVEVVLDIGRLPEVRYLNRDLEYLGEKEVTQEDIDYVTERIEDFTSDNRTGIPGTLHRISAIKNRKGKAIGLTCRIGRVVTGTISCIEDIVKKDRSILFLGRPGVGKTTKLREISRLLADDLNKRVVVVDTSNEIAGDGDVPHAAIGRARRMQVSSPERQKDVMIEAVENHMPEVVIVDEIGTEKEAQAARTIAERGVMLVATAHGNALENLIKNPTLSDLVGGLSSVTLGDDEARRRACQKTVLEREKQPTFDVVIEIRDRNTLAVYPNVAEAVDCILRDWPVTPEIRKVDDKGKTTEIREAPKLPCAEEKENFEAYINKYMKEVNNAKTARKIFVYAVSRSIVDKIIERYELNAEVTRNIDEADVVVSHKSYSKSGAKIINVAKEYHLPIHFVRSNTTAQIQKAVKQALGVSGRPGDDFAEECFDEREEALKEAQGAVYRILNGVSSVELEPRKMTIRKLQHELVEKHNLESTSVGEEPNRRLKIVKTLKNTG